MILNGERLNAFPCKIKNKARMPIPATLIQHNKPTSGPQLTSRQVRTQGHSIQNLGCPDGTISVSLTSPTHFHFLKTNFPSTATIGFKPSLHPVVLLKLELSQITINSVETKRKECRLHAVLYYLKSEYKRAYLF